MRRVLLVCAAIMFAIACTDNITEPTPDRSPATVGSASKTPTVAFATTTTEDGLSISTDKDDYQPGDVVNLTGYGWQPGDVLDIVLTDDPLTHDPHTWTVEVEADGMFHDQTYIVDEGDLNVAFTLVATSRATGRSLTVNFTDNIPAGGITATLNGANSVTVAPGATISLAISARVTSANSQNSPVTWQSTGWVLLTNPATAEPAGKLANCVDKVPNVTGTSGNGTLGTTTFNITAPTTSGTHDLWLALSDQDGTGTLACGGGGQTSKARFVGVVTVVVIDQTRPTVTINQALGQADPTNASPINFTVVFSETVTDFADADVSLSGGGSAGATAAVTGSGTTYNVAVTGMTTTGPVSASIAENVASDAAGNLNEASTSTDNTVVYDKTGPEVTINQKSDQRDPTNQEPILFTVIFDKPVNDFGDEDVTLSGTANPTTADVSGGSDGMNFEVAVTGMTSDGTVTATIAADVAHDLAGNGNMAASSDDNEVTYDVTAPTVTINQATGQADPTNTFPINFTVVFSEPVSGFQNNDILLSGTAHPATAVVSTTDPEVKVYNVAVSGMTGDGTVIATVRVNAADDEATNHSTASTSTDNVVTYDKTPPTVTINQAAGQADPTKASAINFTVVFSEPVADFATGDVTVSGTAGATTGMVSGTGTTYNVAVSDMASGGTVVAIIAAEKASDAAGNLNTASTSTDNTVTYDPQPPVVSDVAASPNPTNGSIAVTATAKVDDASTGNSKIVSAYYKIDGGAEVGMTASDTDFDEPTENVTATIPASTVFALTEGNHQVCVRGVDAAGNTSSFADVGACITLVIDKTPPTLAINQASSQLDPTSASTINFTVVFSEIVTGFATGDVTLSGTAGATTALVTGNGTTYNVAVSGMTSNGTVTATVAAAKAKDLAGNDNVASTSTDNTVTYDTAAPAISNFVISPNPVAVNTPFTISATFTDGLSFVTGAEYSLDGGPWNTLPAAGSTAPYGDSKTENGSITISRTNPDVVNICVRSTDQASNTNQTTGTNTIQCAFLAVYDPTAGFVTGGGWINSPSGAYRADLSLTGKANFGFVSKYQKGATTPTGNTEFQFHAGSLNFSSTAYEWLVVQGQNRASYKGSGTVNGASGYGFLLSVIDNGSSGDRFRMKIWNKSTGAIVYDNQYGADDDAIAAQYIEAGSIVIHTTGGVASK